MFGQHFVDGKKKKKKKLCDFKISFPYVQQIANFFFSSFSSSKQHSNKWFSISQPVMNDHPVLLSLKQTIHSH